MRNKLGFFGLIALVGLLGIFTEDRAYLGFFGFAHFFRYFFVIPDELFKANVQKAATPAFFINLVSFSVSILLRELLHNDRVLIAGFAIGVALSIFVFSITLLVREFREQAVCRHED